MNTGFLFQLLNSFLKLLRFINLVELFKFVGRILTPKNSSIETKIKYSRTSVDIFILAKWIFVAVLILLKISNFGFVITVWYLLIANLYTYFYYHIWSSKMLADPHFDITRIKLRFQNLLFAIFFSVFGFAYFYYIPYSAAFDWAGKMPSFVSSLWYSISNSLTASYDQVIPVTDTGNSISMIQLVIMFIFITIIISSSIPQANIDFRRS
jgi:hypothetical protein